MIPDDRLTKKSKQETNLQSDSRPYLNGLTYNNPTYESQAKCFSPRNASRLLNESAVDQLQTALTKSPKHQAWACFHWLPTRKTRMAMVHKGTPSARRIELTESLFW